MFSTFKFQVERNGLLEVFKDIIMRVLSHTLFIMILVK